MNNNLAKYSLGLLPIVAFSSNLYANPEGMQVKQGTATSTVNGSQLTIKTSDRVFLEWQSFNIKPGQTTTFEQPAANSIAFNQINDQNPSQIFGNIHANGILVLANQSGFYFGPNSVVKAAGLIVTTTPTLPSDFMNGGAWVFSGPPPLASIINYGAIGVEKGGAAYLIAEKIENHGIMSAPDGNIGLYAGKEVMVSERPDGRGLSAKVTLPEGSVDNTGKLIADSGTIAACARVVNQGGLMQANSIIERNGSIELIASDAVHLNENSILRANGADNAASAAGSITVKAEKQYTDKAGSAIEAVGGKSGGKGGNVELSAPQMASIHTKIDAHAEAGYAGGTLLIDPTDVIIGAIGGGSPLGGDVGYSDAPDTLRLDVNSSFVGLSQIRLEAARNITLAGGTQWDLSQSTGKSEPESKLTLRAGNNITLQSASSLLAGDNWHIDMASGVDFAKSTAPISGKGGVYLEGTAFIEAGGSKWSISDGKAEPLIRIAAGIEVLIRDRGAIRTTGGGGIEVTTLSGNIDSGQLNSGYTYFTTGKGYQVNGDVGGISSAKGGNVTLSAGGDGDVVAFMPVPSPLIGTQQDAGSGAFGADPGDVTISGRNVYGHFVVANGNGRITARNQAGTSREQLALSLVKGLWDVTGIDIILQEVRNPNGMFNYTGAGRYDNAHRFDYDPASSVKLTAENSIQLRGEFLPRNKNDVRDGMPIIYPPNLEMSAGSGGVLIAQSITLFPAADANLSISTRKDSKGSLWGAINNPITRLTMSDSGKSQYKKTGDFGPDDHAAQSIHANDSKPVLIDVDGDVRDINISVPKLAKVHVGHDWNNAGFKGQNYHDSDITSLNVGGNIINRNSYTFVDVGSVNPLDIFLNAVDQPDQDHPNLPTIDSLIGFLTYLPGSQRLAFYGQMTSSALYLLSHIQVKTFDEYNRPIKDAFDNFVTTPVSLLDAALLNALYINSQGTKIYADGIKIGGAGKLAIRAQDMELGVTDGVISAGPSYNPDMAHFITKGTDIDIQLSGGLTMYSSTIQSQYGGDIFILCDGSVNVGTQEYLGRIDTVRGILSIGHSDVTVIAKKDIDVNGSRIASYNGGNVMVRSEEGNVNAGSGALTYVRLEVIKVDPNTSEVTISKQAIPGSGIIAAALKGFSYAVGNITIETPHGDINANAGGIVQLAFSGIKSLSSTISLKAGTRDAKGNVVHPGNISAENSGVMGQNINMEAAGDIKGLVVAQQGININAKENVNVTAIAQTGVNIAGATISGTVISVGGAISAKGDVNQSAILQADSGGNTGFAAGNAGASASSAKQAEEPAKVAEKTVANTEEDDLKKKKPSVVAVRTKGRVTVILPKS